MATKKGKEKATPKPPARRGTKRALVAEPSSTAVKPPTKRVKRIIKVDEKEKAFPAKDTARFPNRYCEQMFPILAERSYNNEHLFILPPNIATFVEPQIERRQWGFLQRQPRQANLSWVVEFYYNFYLPSLQSVFVRQKQVAITEEAIQQALSLPPIPEGLDAFQEAALKRQMYQFNWEAVLRVIALPGSRWIYGYHRTRPKGILASALTLEARVWGQIISHYIFPSTHESSFTADMAVLLWCILTDQPLNLPRHIRNAMGHVQIAGNLPFPALVSDLVLAARVSYRAGDTKAMLPRDDYIGSHDGPDCGDTATSPPLFLIDGTEDGAKP
ncbi:uncharacterized protein DS421_19g656050 [Arachis hypogaea]|uniref:Putative plant transposon protein domain-containing protein n=1 Tax=Arachis hypogaea TaxID=3818 RepID=A0A6B9VAT2_ARAHY|nr:uncharacterized protein DS421_19g656050 [Arachis hypogaea]